MGESTSKAKSLICAMCISAAMLLTAVSCVPIEPEFFPMNASGKTSFGVPRSASEVEMYITKKPDYKYTELGMITFDNGGNRANEPEIYNRLRVKAGEIGADGIIIMNSQTSIEQRPAITYDYWGYPIDSDIAYSIIKYRGMAIKRDK